MLYCAKEEINLKIEYLLSMLSFGKHIAIVCNPLAGVGHAVILANKIAAALTERKIIHSLILGNWPSNFERITDIFIVGGDGTLNYFINKYRDIEIPFAIFNGGTGNDIHWLLYGKMNFEEQLDLVLTTKPRPIDAGKCNDKYFMNGVGIGFEGAVAKSLTGKRKRPGKASFMSAILKAIFFYRSKKYITKLNDAFCEKNHFLISVMNGQRTGGGFHIAPKASINDGLLEIVLVDELHPLFRIHWLPVIEKGNHLTLSFVEYSRSKQIVIESHFPIEAHLDGEYYESKRLAIEVLPAKYLAYYK